MTSEDLQGRKGRIYEFDPKTQLPGEGILIFTGKTKSGKTTAMIDIMYHYRNKIDIPIAFVGTMDTAIELRKHLPECQIFTEFREDKLRGILNKADEDFELGGREAQKKVLILIDDFSYLKNSIFNSATFRRYASNCRHGNSLLLISTQFCKDIPPFIRDATQRVFICANKNPKQREKIFDAYNSYFYNFQDFDRVMVRLTENYGIMVMDNDSSSGYKLEESVFRWKATTNREFKVAPTSPIWDFNRRWLDDRYRESERKARQRKEEEEKKVKSATEQRRRIKALKRIPGELDIDFTAERPKKVSSFDHSKFFRIR